MDVDFNAVVVFVVDFNAVVIFADFYFVFIEVVLSVF